MASVGQHPGNMQVTSRQGSAAGGLAATTPTNMAHRTQLPPPALGTLGIVGDPTE